MSIDWLLQLTKVYGMRHPELPSYKKLFGFGFGLFGSTKPSQIEEMKRNLESFAMSAVTSFPVPPTELLKFVEYPFTVSSKDTADPGWVGCNPQLWAWS